MVIANPIYDVVFKRMMENERVAKFFIGTLLDQTIENIQVKPQEFTYTDKLAGLAVFRLDFIATIKTEAGEQKKILIEIQKAKNQIDLMRFRNYLAEQYKKEDIVENDTVALPITTIYILGFTLPEIDTACMKVERNYKDLLNNRIIYEKSEFIEKLTHDSFVVQVERIADNYSTKLEKLLSIFEQNNFIDEQKITKEFKHTLDNEDLKLTTDILHFSGTNAEERKKIEIEQEAWRSINAMFADKEKKFIQELAENKKALAENKKALAENKKALAENKKALAENKKALEEKDRLIEELMKKLNEQK